MSLALPEVTLCCVDTREPTLALGALQHCMSHARFARVLLFTDPALLPSAPPGIERIAVRIDSVADYSHFMLRGLAPHLHTSHLLVVQWDGYVLDPAAWDPAFLQCDYIGAPWHDRPAERAVGNGGFSLRSRRLLQALQDPALAPAHPEDLCICDTHREALERRHGIRFASPAMAARFAYERTEPAGPTFGFHGLFNFDRVLPPAALGQRLATLPDALLRGLDGHDLCQRLIAQGRLDEAALIVAARRRLGMHDRRTLRLRARLAWARWRA
ncbi:MAG: hypothetical protein HY855_26150 [Burkholderiales bacterium]|nr:hypothetical protein [Burkholderiales bacterium]